MKAPMSAIFARPGLLCVILNRPSWETGSQFRGALRAVSTLSRRQESHFGQERQRQHRERSSNARRPSSVRTSRRSFE
jgi:hypothetical protein